MDSHPMDEPFDEIMGMNNNPKKKSVQTSQEDVYSSSLVTPDPSPTYSDTASTRSASGPPSNAFVHTSAKDRWAQYERDDIKLKEESDEAYAAAVASAAERAAMRQSAYSSNSMMDPSMMEQDDEFASPSRHSTHSTPSPDQQFRRYYDDPDRQVIQDRMDRAGASLPPPEPSRSTRRSESGTTPKEILKSLSRMGKNSSSPSRYEEEAVDFEDPHDKVRAEAMKVLEMADGMSSRSNSRDDDTASSKRHVPAALSGLDFGSTGSPRSQSSLRKPYRDERFAIDDDDDEDLVDVVEAERNSSGRAFDMEGESGSPKKSWSSRYANPLNSHLTTLTGGNRSSTSSILDTYDRQHARQARSGKSFSPRQDSSPSSGGIFGSGFSFRQNHVFGKQQPSTPSQYNLQNHRTVWMDVDINSSNGRSLPPPSPARSWQSTLERKRLRRRRLCIVFVLTVIVAVILGIIFGTKDSGSSSDGSFSLSGKGVGQTISFYVTANVPFDVDDQKKLEGDLKVIPGDADFITHLGNIQDASVTLCNEAVYEDVGIVLQESPVPVFMLPGPEDWNNCPIPEDGWQNWMDNFEEFESNFNNHFTTDRQLGRTENFSFVHRGVLFIGLHLLGGRIPDQEEWDLRHQENVQWVEEKLSENPDSYRAVVMLGNARPSQQQHEFFREAVNDIKRIGKPTLYIHANGGVDVQQEYRPFKDADNFWAVQAQDGGTSPPLRVTIGFGSKPFQVGSQTEEEEEPEN